MKQITLFIALMSVCALFAVRPPEKQVQGVIVCFDRAVSESELIEPAGNRFMEIVSLNPEHTYWLFRYDERFTESYQAIDIIRKLPHYAQHQMDGPVYFRTSTPDDPKFPNQWHIQKIAADLAWDSVTNGVNRRGDTIVIAVIDDGLHTNHPDFQGNIWINYADTADNGIDDDNNGYIDDHYGWNFMSNNNDISDSNYYVAGHGTPIAGIIGARGNNATGICGILWQVKLMIVDLTDTSFYPQIWQSEVIKAYSYVLHQRKLYNESNGQKGAFVVATNSSWGVDGWKPNQTPLWCAFYDTLGKYGILNASAVSNFQNNQVDISGDIPTLCTSDHLITVGSSTSGDAYFSCGYSPVSVDMSAPGASIYSSAAYTAQNIQNDNVYRSGFSGTSYSTPMVTAAIGVLHAHACEKVLDSIKMNPAKGNLLLRQFILKGVDKIDDLAGRSVTGGRLNIRGAMQAMENFCLGIEDTSSVLDPAYLSGITLFPNPGDGNVQIFSADPIVDLQCYDLTGRSVQFTVNDNMIDVSANPAGVYFFILESKGRRYNYKYVKTSQ